MDWPTPQRHLLYLADKDIAKRTQWASLVYLIVFLLIISFTPYLKDHYYETIFLGVFISSISVVRTILVMRYDKYYISSPDRWRIIFSISTYLLAGAWGVFCMMAVAQYNLEWTAMLVVLSTAGIASVAVTTLCIYPNIIIVFLILMLVPSICVTAYLSTKQSFAVMIMFLIFAFYLYFVAKRLSREYWTALENSFLLDHRARQLEGSNRELESYSYSIAHDLRGPLRTITAFSQILLDEANDRLKISERDYLNRIVHAAKYLADLIDDILELSRLTRLNISHVDVNLTAIAEECIYTLRSAEPERFVNVKIEKNLIASGDAKLLRIVLQNLLGNAWKFTRTCENPEIAIGTIKQDSGDVFYVSDNGIGFDMKYAKKIFGIFQRLHTRDEFEGTGIGLANVERVITRHGGSIWVDAKPNEGAAFYFTLPGRHL